MTAMPAGDEPLRYPDIPATHFIHRAQMRRLADGRRPGWDAAVEMDLTPDCTNGTGALQGGMLATLVDCAAGQAVRTCVAPGVGFSTQDMAINYLAGLRRGPAVAQARVRRAGRRAVVIQVEVIDAGEDDRLCALATTTFALLA